MTERRTKPSEISQRPTRSGSSESSKQKRRLFGESRGHERTTYPGPYYTGGRYTRGVRMGVGGS